MAELGVGAFTNGRAQPLTEAFLGMLELLWESKFEHSRMAKLLEFKHSRKNWKVRAFANGRTFMGEPPAMPA